MAVRRSFSPDIVTSDRFLDMPVSARELYFQLGMRADDDGFVSPRATARTVGASDDDLKILIAKGFVIPFESGVIVIRDWLINNRVRKDWYRPTQYAAERALLTGGAGKPYVLKTDEKSLFSLGTESVPNRQRFGVVVSKLDSKKEGSFENENGGKDGDNPDDRERGARHMARIKDVITGTQKRLFG
jgi:hypothetical protein